MQAAQRELAQIRPESEQLVFQVKELSVARRDLQARETALLIDRLARTESQSEGLARERLSLLQQLASLQTELRQCGELTQKQKQ
ncbi:MAG: hypothetical protein ABI476_05685 [Oxalobacteraceae bacterium]